ncbi:DUF4175 domain-containing protein [Lysobacter sp. S4-A87]|uniref:DUF4175 domain-containing protein n=1 Tax=Lysobacter sp. S4-A87 TaxID=2925843 RepID=UPI001F52CA9B|nr:DUF4175 domain-containing protein [Lysobacter sp. S4-A87]UNK51133.1 DUF4175 domain-containing protein [Lysobacter sp. S4-A87]
MTVLQRALQQARRRRGLDAALRCVPWMLVAIALAWRLGGIAAALAVLLVAAVATAAFAFHRARMLDTRWLVRELDASRTDMDDSTDLLFAPTASMTGLERLQLGRLQQRIENAPPPDVRPRWSTRVHAIGNSIAIVAIAATLLWPARPGATFEDVLSSVGVTPAAPTQTRIVQQRLQITPPGYTRQPARDDATLDAKAPQGTRLQWTLGFAPQPASAELVFHDGRRLKLSREGDDWRGNDVLARSALYRIVVHDAPPLQPATLHRLDAIPDRAPQLRVLEPDRSLSLMTQGQRSWALAFEGSDDYGVASTATLRITLAQGSGENITFREQSMTIGGGGSATVKRFAHRLDLAALGLAAGDDLIVQLSVNDNRTPTVQSARSASLILRWPSDLGTETTGLEGMVKKVLPAYFRSQRQIIIDAEALLKEKRKLEADRYVKRSDAIGVDQRILRLRYGQFLGEEAEGEPKPPPTNDADADDAHGADETTAAPADEHGHAEAGGAGKFGEEGAVLEEYGHTHDHAEAATLLDPETRKLLKSALDEMWQSEGHLRQGHPELALPYAYRALRFIKQVQQATRIYLARVGPELPPIDESRRMSGDRAGLARRDDALVAADIADPTLAALWSSLDASQVAAAPIDFTALERWLREHESRLADPLAFVAAIEALRADPDCVTCRADLRALLWPLLPRPAAAVPRRNAGDAAGRRYLEALRQEEPK